MHWNSEYHAHKNHDLPKEVSQTGYMYDQSGNNHLYVNNRNATEGSIYMAFMLWE